VARWLTRDLPGEAGGIIPLFYPDGRKRKIMQGAFRSPGPFNAAKIILNNLLLPGKQLPFQACHFTAVECPASNIRAYFPCRYYNEKGVPDMCSFFMRHTGI